MDQNTSTQIAKVAIAMLKRWGTKGNSGMVDFIATDFGVIYRYENVIQIFLSTPISTGLILYGLFTDKISIERQTGHSEVAIQVLLILSNYLTSLDLVENKKPDHLEILSGIITASKMDDSESKIFSLLTTMEQAVTLITHQEKK